MTVKIMSEIDTFAEMRDSINRTDDRILRLLRHRARLAARIGDAKRETGRPVFDPQREASRALVLAERAEALGLSRRLGRELAALLASHGVAAQLTAPETPEAVEAPTATEAFRLAALRPGQERTLVRVGKAEFGAGLFEVIAGPCAIESEAGIHEAADHARAAGARILRGGAFKPRTSPYDFQGSGMDGVRWLADAAHSRGMACVTEVLDPRQAAPVAEHADMLQIGARNMQNVPLLRACAATGRTILLKRGPSATLRELLCAAEYILLAGNGQVVLCERGIKTFETETRNTLDLSSVPALRRLTHLPVIVDPSHAAGRRELVAPLSRAAHAVGADGLIVEMHPRPDEALSDKRQALTPGTLMAICEDIQLASVRK